jgi:trans-2,3-dihydro-3-hydroxyanthranilate isomerase
MKNELYGVYDMRDLKYFITDVFPVRKYSGNQLATFCNCGDLSSEEMQSIAHEINYSETTFITSYEVNNGGYDVRIFTPKHEIDFAGHPTLGTAFIIQQHLMNEFSSKVLLNLKVGQIPVHFIENQDGTKTLWMDQFQPTWGKTFDVAQIANLLRLKESDISTDYPLEEVSTGLPFLIVPLKSLDALKQANVEKAIYDKHVENNWAKGIMIFCPEGYENDMDISARVFVDYYGVPEDPATGSANGCLAGYLIKNRFFNSDTIEKTVGQGYEIDRPSRLFLKAHKERDKIKISVGGDVVEIAQGNWF